MTDPVVVGNTGTKIVYDSSTMRLLQLEAEANSWTAILQLNDQASGSGYTVPVGKKLLVYSINYTVSGTGSAQVLGINTSTAGIGNRCCHIRVNGATPSSTGTMPCAFELAAGEMLVASIYYGSWNCAGVEMDA
jgi:hypothetical protein|tara:strand:+ start:905 stop:1306 length:402 start_codon:yes stop_codon:yes gene_type:complete